MSKPLAKKRKKIFYPPLHVTNLTRMNQSKAYSQQVDGSNVPRMKIKQKSQSHSQQDVTSKLRKQVQSVDVQLIKTKSLQGHKVQEEQRLRTKHIGKNHMQVETRSGKARKEPQKLDKNKLMEKEKELENIELENGDYEEDFMESDDEVIREDGEREVNVDEEIREDEQREVDEDEDEEIREDEQREEKYSIVDSGRKWTLQTINSAWRRWKCLLKQQCFTGLKNDGERWKKRPKTVPKDQFRALLKIWHSKNARKASEKNKESRNSQTLLHTAGSKSFARIRRDMEKELNRPPTDAEVFLETRKKKKKAQPEKTLEMIDTLERLSQSHFYASSSSFTKRIPTAVQWVKPYSTTDTQTSLGFPRDEIDVVSVLKASLPSTVGADDEFDELGPSVSGGSDSNSVLAKNPKINCDR